MINEILVYAGPGPIEWLIIILVAGVPILLVVFFARVLLRNKKENVRLRLEVGKLADELEQAQKQADSQGEDESGSQAG